MNNNKLIEKTNKAISELVSDNSKLRKAYNYYNCIRDPELFKYLEENFGIGLPTEVSFIPLIKKHVDALVGEYLDIPIQPKVSCKDEKTIHNIFREKLLKIASECANLLQQNLKNNLLRFIGNLDFLDLNIKEQLDHLIEDLNENFISEYEIAGLNIIEYIIQSRNTDLHTKLKLLFIDLLVTGYNFYLVRPSASGKNIEIRCLSPLDVFPDLNYNSPYIKDCPRIVVRTLMTRNQILNKYGKLLSKKDRATIEEMWSSFEEGSFYVRSYLNSDGTPATSGIRAGEEITPLMSDWKSYDSNLIPVYEVEWLEVDKNFVMQRYKTIRIGEEIYVLTGKDDTVIRTLDNPTYCTLSINGVYFNNRKSEPYSLVFAGMELLD